MAATAPRKTAARKAAAAPAAPAVPADPTPNGLAVAAGPEVPSEPVPAAQAETAIEDIPDGAIAVPLGPHGDVVHLLPRRNWSSSALTALHQGDLEAWASKCLHKPDYERIWVGLDPTVGEAEDMLRQWQELTGDDVGKASARRGSLRNGRRR